MAALQSEVLERSPQDLSGLFSTHEKIAGLSVLVKGYEWEESREIAARMRASKLRGSRRKHHERNVWNDATIDGRCIASVSRESSRQTLRKGWMIAARSRCSVHSGTPPALVCSPTKEKKIGAWVEVKSPSLPALPFHILWNYMDILTIDFQTNKLLKEDLFHITQGRTWVQFYYMKHSHYEQQVGWFAIIFSAAVGTGIMNLVRVLAHNGLPFIKAAWHV